MKNVVLFVAAISFLNFVPEEANAQRLLGRIFGVRPTATRTYTPVVQRSYSYSPSTNRIPQPVTGYGANLHRNYMIRRAQKQAAITGLPPRRTSNILWDR